MCVHALICVCLYLDRQIDTHAFYIYKKFCEDLRRADHKHLSQVLVGHHHKPFYYPL